jgi:hypothetical protein
MRSSPFALVLLLASIPGCGDDGEPAGDAAAKSIVGETKIEPTVQPPAPAPLPEDPFAEDEWEAPAADTETDAAAPTEPPATVMPAVADGPWPGPCKLSYKGGPILRFKYTDAGGTVRTDADGDGKVDVCSKFDRKEGHTTRISIDLDCNQKTDLRIEPVLEDGTNLATAKVTATEANGGNRQMTMIELGLFAGLEPGFPIAAPRANVDATVKDGRVTKAAVKGEGGDEVALSYDKDGRIKGLSEDTGGDGTIDRKFAYRYDAKGNVTRIDVSVTTPGVGGAKGTTKKQTATVDYSCWK